MAGLSLISNVSAFNAFQNIQKSSINAVNSVKRLSSGDTLVNASDNVANQAIGTSLDTSINTLKALLVNNQQVESFLKTADGALNSISQIVQRQKEISVLSQNAALNVNDSAYLQQEFDQLSEQIDSIIASTKFGNMQVFNTQSFNAQSIYKNGLDTFTPLASLNRDFVDGIIKLLDIAA